MITVKVDSSTVEALLKDVQQRRIPYAMSMALTATAKDMRDQIKQAMPVSFDRPVPFTVNSMQVTPARKNKLEATVWWRWPLRALPDKHYMMSQVFGNPRSRTRTEKMFGKIPGFGGKYFTPASGAQLDRYGNWSSGERNKVLSALQLFGEQGYSANRTARSTKRNAGRQREYFAIIKPTGGLQPGIYERVQTGVGFGAKTKRSMAGGATQKGNRKVAIRNAQGKIIGWEAASSTIQSVIRARGAKPILVPTKSSPRYNKRLPFFEIGRAVYDARFMANLANAINTVGGWS